MPTPAERRALAFVAVVFLAGASVRAVAAIRVDPGPNDGAAAALERQVAAVDSATRADSTRRTRKRARRSAAPGRAPVPGPVGGAVAASGAPRGLPAPGMAEPAGAASGLARVAALGLIDVDRASAGELEELPRVGPALARRIVADRDSLGPFGSLDGLQRVKGVGCAVVMAVRAHVTFSLPPRPALVRPRGHLEQAANPCLRRARVPQSRPP